MGGSKLHVRGVTYGSFRETDGIPFPAPERVRADFDAIAAAGLNAVRTYHVPPEWLMDLAIEQGLRIMVGLPWEQHVAFLDDRGRAKAIEARVREEVRMCAGHRAVLCYVVGSEIPATIVRWHGRRKIERFIERLYLAAKEEDEGALATYVNYPSTEYLDLPFLDVVAFNVFLEREPAFEAYLARLQNIAGNRPLLVTETGLDSSRHGRERQAEVIKAQIAHTFAMGTAGVFVFSWTDEWHRGGADVLDWDFGVVDRERRPKPALHAVRDAFGQVPFPRNRGWPRVSAIVCTRNGERTLPECLRRLEALRYPDYEVIVVSDGSTDATDEIAQAHDSRLVRIEHQGLGAARNTGIQHASGEIIAFLDDDAYPDPDWLHYLAASFTRSSHAAIGGPNIPPPAQRLVADAVAASPGGPIHVLITDNEAEHIPGCNMAFRREALDEVHGFDERFKVAADDVDICWRLHELGYSVGFNAGAVVMHRRRDSVRRYLRQQYEYGKAEALLERKWPSRYNRAGYPRWAGRIYGGLHPPGRRGSKIHYGTWGAGLFQSIYEPAQGMLASLPLMPEWYLMIAVLGGIAALGVVWQPLLLALPLLALSSALSVQRVAWSGWRAHRRRPGESRRRLFLRRSLTAALHLLQPLARLAGRIRGGLSPWRRRRREVAPAVPLPRTISIWSETWQAAETMLLRIESTLKEESAAVRRGGPFDRWDFDVRGGSLGSTRLRLALEEHGFGRQLVRVRVWPRVGPIAWVMATVAAGIAAAAVADGAIAIGAGFAVAAVLMVELAISHCRCAMGLALLALAHQADAPEKVAIGGLEPLPASPLDALAAELGATPRRGSLRHGRRPRRGRVAPAEQEAASLGDQGSR